MASIEELTGKSRDAILADIMDRGRAVTPEQYIARERIAELERSNASLAADVVDTLRALLHIFGPDGAHKVTTAVCEMRALQTQPQEK